MLLFIRQAVEQRLFSLFLLFLGPSLRCMFGFFAGRDGGNYVANYRLVLPKGFPAGCTRGKMLLQAFLLVVAKNSSWSPL